VKERIETGELSDKRLETLSQVLVWADEVLRRIEGNPAAASEIAPNAEAFDGYPIQAGPDHPATRMSDELKGTLDRLDGGAPGGGE
jgi:hypothetical protein